MSAYVIALPPTVLRLDLHDRRRQRRLAVVDVTDRADVHVRLGADELLLGHRVSPASCLDLRLRPIVLHRAHHQD